MKGDVNNCEEVKGYDKLKEMALDFAWSWQRSHSADKIWKQLDPDLWELLCNPWVILQTISREKLELAFQKGTFSKDLDELLQTYKEEIKAPAWYQRKHPKSPLNCIAYFSMEFMLAESLPIYSGGLGNVAGDQLKAASDLGIPVIGIGLLYQQGYFRQMINKDGTQQALYPYNDPGQLPIVPLRKPSGEWVRFQLALPGWSVWVRGWEVKIGRVKLYLLDTNDAANYPAHRGITSELYGGDSELRLKQEIVLGMGGWHLLEILGIKPDVCHLNEGHAALAVLERAQSLMKEKNTSFDTALAVTRAGNLFTTHTAVAAGFDRFSPALIEQYLGEYAKTKLGITTEDLLSLGRIDPQDGNEAFNMAYLAIRGSGAINGVSRLHGVVSRCIFEPLFPRWPTEEVPIGHVTNGVHMPTWGSATADDLWKEFCGRCSTLGLGDAALEHALPDFRRVPDDRLWQMRNKARLSLVEYVRRRLSKIWASRGFSASEIERAKHIFNPEIFTLGFARRFATYKRPNMLLHDPERLIRILTNPQRPVQLLIAGKAHPADLPGQEMLRKWIEFFRRPEARAHVVFLTDYDMLVTQHLVKGVDLWLNTPRRPWEACGTSGMKVLVNGGLNLSELDGWWAEAYQPDIGWAIGDGQEHGDDPAWDATEANKLYELLEKEIVPEFYNRDDYGRPKAWIARIRESMARLTPQFSANRAVCDYTEKHYIPAAENYKKRLAQLEKADDALIKWQQALQKHWQSVRFGGLKVETKQGQHIFEQQVYLGDLDVNAVRIELFASGQNGLEKLEMTRIRQHPDHRTYTYQISVADHRKATDYTVRLVPYFPGAQVPLEANYILWQH